MPKGRRSEEAEIMAQLADRDYTIKNSPYGTSHTSKLRYRIVGSKLMPVVEDGVYPQPLTGREYPMDARSRPMPEKPNHIWPSQTQPPLAQEDPAFRSSTRNDRFYDAISHVSKPQNDPLHPFSVLPPVRADMTNYQSNDYSQSYPQNNDTSMQDLLRRLPGSRLPNEPLRFSPSEMSFLMNRVRQELEGYISQRLKDIYVEMTTFDRRLSGLIHFDDFIFAAKKHQLRCDPSLLRLVASMFVVPSTPNFVNYEKILSFIGAALKSDIASNYSGTMATQQPEYSTRRSLDPMLLPHVEPHEGWNQSPRSTGLKTAKPEDFQRPDNYSPVAAQSIDHVQPASNVEPRRKLEVEGNQAKLLSILHEALKDYTREDFNRLVDAFYLWDREKKGTLTVDDIKTVAYRQNLRVTNSVINALLDLCYVRWDQYDWRKFVKYVEAALPSSLGQEPVPKVVISNGHVTSDALRESLNQPVIVPADSSLAQPKYSPRGSGTISPSGIHSDAARAWFDRFMRLSKALYTVDSKYVGHLPPDDIRWITNEYNRVYELGLCEPDVEEAIGVSSTHSGLVNIDSYLRSLSLRGHY